MVELYAPAEYWKLTPEERASFRCGPGRGILEKLVPDYIYAGWPFYKPLCITPACAIHDFCYGTGEDTIAWKKESDRIFLNNLVRIVESCPSCGLVRKARLDRCKIYYKAVKVFGGPAFWAGRNKPENLSVLNECLA